MKRVLAGLTCLLLLPGAVPAAHLVDQVIQLQPGWNAVYLQVQPTDNSTVAMFAGVPISSAWVWLPKGQPTEFYQNMTEEMTNDARWLAYFPTNRVQSMFNNLFALTANDACFIKLAGTNAFTWTVTGRPAVPRNEWRPNIYNLAGFPLDPANPPSSFAAFFASDAALASQSIYRLSSAGAWQALTAPAATPMRAGEAFWLFAATESSYQGPVKVSVTQGDGLDFGASAPELSVLIQNLSSAATTVQVRNLGGSGPISYWTLDPADLTVVWDDLPSPLTLNLAAGETHDLRLSVRREEFSGTSYETTLEVTSPLGTRVLIPVTSQK